LLNISFPFQSSDPFKNRSNRFADLFGYLFVGKSGILLKKLENAKIGLIQCMMHRLLSLWLKDGRRKHTGR
jgi:hypothetical protein